MPDAPECTTSARPSPSTSAASSPVLESGLLMKPFVAKATFVAGKTKAAPLVNAPPSGFRTITAVAPPASEGFTGPVNLRVVALTNVGVSVVCVGPGLKTTVAPDWKLRPTIVNGPETDARFGVML